MLRFILRRLLQLVPVLLAIATLNFFLLQIAPGDAADIIAGQSGHATPEFVAALRAEFGLDQPMWKQYLLYLGKLVTLDLGYSFQYQLPVTSLIADRLPATLLLMVPSLLIAVGLGVVLGVIASRRRGGWVDSVVSIGALVVYATPVFWLGLMLIVLFSIQLGWLPSGGIADVREGNTGLAHVLDVAHHLVLPVITMALFYVAIYTRLMRASMLEVYSLDFITTARAKGVPEGGIAWRHAARNALLPVVTLAGLQFGHLLGGSVLVETVFGWPGLGRLVFDSLLQRDLNLLLGILFVSSVVVVIANLLADLTYGVLDPRIVHK
ncbi:MAG TPA: ABC transporter permease [Usitatibacter sp.]|nr:ABC transporter permease [Usitatibacter sp.]